MPRRRPPGALSILAAIFLVAGCGFFSNPGPTASPADGSNPTAEPTPTPTPTPEPRQIKSIVLVGAIEEPVAGSPSAVTWQGVQEAGKKVGAETKLVTPLTRGDLSARVEDAVKGGATIVVAVGPESAPAMLQAAAAHPGTQFFIVDLAVAADAPANLHGLTFDEAEEGYLAGFVAAGVSGAKKVGFVGDLESDPRTISYVSGFRNGAAETDPSISAGVAYAGRKDDTQRGRSAAAGLIKNGADVIVAAPGLSGDGAARAACDRKVRVVVLDTDAEQVLPDVSSCLVVSVVKRYDVAARDAILRFASGGELSGTILNDVASGGVAVTDFHSPVTPALKDQLATVLAVLKSGPPRPTPTPAASEAPSSASTAP